MADIFQQCRLTVLAVCKHRLFPFSFFLFILVWMHIAQQRTGRCGKGRWRGDGDQLNRLLPPQPQDESSKKNCSSHNININNNDQSTVLVVMYSIIVVPGPSGIRVPQDYERRSLDCPYSTYEYGLGAWLAYQKKISV